MADILIKCKRLDGADAVVSGRPYLELHTEMTSDQMKDALAKFLEKITDAEWSAWLKEFAADALEAAYEHGHATGSAGL